MWIKRVERWRGSGLGAKEFAEQAGVDSDRLRHWKWRLAREELALVGNDDDGEVNAAFVSLLASCQLHGIDPRRTCGTCSASSQLAAAARSGVGAGLVAADARLLGHAAPSRRQRSYFWMDGRPGAEPETDRIDRQTGLAALDSTVGSIDFRSSVIIGDTFYGSNGALFRSCK